MPIMAFVAFCQASMQSKGSLESEKCKRDMIDYRIVHSVGGERGGETSWRQLGALILGGK